MTRRLLQAMAGARHGGAETFFVRLVSALHRVGEDQRILIRRDADRSHTLRTAGVAVTELAFGGPLDVGTRFGFRRAIAAWHPDIVLTWMSRATQACPKGDFVHVARLGGYYDLKYYRRCDHLIANTARDRRLRPGQGLAAPLLSVICRILFRIWLRCRGVPTRRATAPLALAIGRLHQNKGFALLLEALAMTHEVHLDVAGDGPLRGELEVRARDLGIADRVRFLGWRDDVPALLARADFLVCPSLHEPLGNVVIEAWSAGLPVIATASDGPAALIEDEDNGLLVPLPGQPGGGPAALAAAIERLSRSPELRRQLGQGGRRAYEAEFTEAAVVARYRAFFDRLTPVSAARRYG